MCWAGSKISRPCAAWSWDVLSVVAGFVCKGCFGGLFSLYVLISNVVLIVFVHLFKCFLSFGRFLGCSLWMFVAAVELHASRMLPFSRNSQSRHFRC